MMMKNVIMKGLTIVAFGFILNSSVMAGEDVDAFTLSFQSNVQELAAVDAVISRASFVSEENHYSQHNVLNLNYDSKN